MNFQPEMVFSTSACKPTGTNPGLDSLMVDSSRIHAICRIGMNGSGTLFRFPKSVSPLPPGQYTSPTDPARQSVVLDQSAYSWPTRLTTGVLWNSNAGSAAYLGDTALNPTYCGFSGSDDIVHEPLANPSGGFYRGAQSQNQTWFGYTQDAWASFTSPQALNLGGTCYWPTGGLAWDVANATGDGLSAVLGGGTILNGAPVYLIDTPTEGDAGAQDQWGLYTLQPSASDGGDCSHPAGRPACTGKLLTTVQSFKPPIADAAAPTRFNIVSYGGMIYAVSGEHYALSIVRIDPSTGTTTAVVPASPDAPDGFPRLVLDGSFLYWTQPGPHNVANHGSVMRLDLATPGATPTAIVSGRTLVSDVAVDDQYVYWIELLAGPGDTTTAGTYESIFRVRKP
jgi:hypothetical protein